MFHRIIVPLDESPVAEQALPVAARIARASGGTLHLIHVVLDATQFVWQYGDAALVSADIIQADYSRAQTYLQQMASRESLRGITVETEVLSGDPARAIVEACQASKADLLVMCTHGYTGIKHWLLGSVATRMAHRSNVPLLLLHPESKEGQAEAFAHQDQIRVMVPLDGSPLAEEAIEPAATLSHMLSSSGQTSLHLAGVLPLNELEWPLVDRELTMKQADAYFTTVKQRLLKDTDQQLSITTSITISPDVASTLVELAESGKGKDAEQAPGTPRCDIIAIATHGRGAFARWVLGSIAERILHTSRIPVLLLRPRQMQLESQETQQHEALPEKTPVAQQAGDDQAWVGLF